MLDKMRSLLCVECNTRYMKFLDIITRRYNNLLMFTEVSALEKEIKEYNHDGICLIFLDNLSMNKLSYEACSLLSSPNFICIILLEDYHTSITREAYIYDMLVCQNPHAINNFLIRLEDDLKHRQDYHFLEKKFKKFDTISLQLTSERNINSLLDLIIDSCMELTYAEAGTIYVVIDKDTSEWSYYEKHADNKYLKFILAKNKARTTDLEQRVLSISQNSINGYTVLTGESLSIDDVYAMPQEVAYKFDSSFDKLTGYKTTSMLNVPMKDHHGRILGVIQLINKKNSSVDIPFDSTDELLVSSLAGLAAVSLENALLYKTKEKLLEEYRLTIKQEVVRRTKADDEVSKLLSAIEHSPMSVAITDPYGNIEYVNSKFTQLTGYSTNEIIGRNISIFESGEHSKEFYESFWNSIHSGQDWYGEFHNKKKNGELYWEFVSVSSIKDENNKVKYFIVVKEDITEKKSITQLLEIKNLELQNTIDELNNAHSQLIQKEKMAAVGQLAAGIAHEINNPLGFIISNHDTMQKYTGKLKHLIDRYRAFSKIYSHLNDVSDITNYEKTNKIDFIMDDISELHSESSEGLNRIGTIITALRAFSHIDHLDNFQEYDINEGILNTLTISSSKLKYTHITIEKQLNDVPRIRGNGREINQVILNMLMNAVDAILMKDLDGIGIIKIQTYLEKNYVCFEIEDDGVGISQEIQNRIFEPFYTTKPIGKGTGLGLSISYDIIIKKHHGEILVQSTPGIGSKFIIKLPSHNNQDHK